MQSAALDEHHVVFCIEHSWISYLPEIMNPIEAVLEGSEIPNLFGDDLESLAKPLKTAAQQDGFQESLSAYFWLSKYLQTHKHIQSYHENVNKCRFNSQESESVFTSCLAWKAKVIVPMSYSKIIHRCTNALKSFGWQALWFKRPNM